jgi:hypothetical protein
MAVPVMDIPILRMLMTQRRVIVPMRVGLAVRIIGAMSVVMMLVVNMRAFMIHIPLNIVQR